jgi:ribosomal protein S18 acetylase RimI-like enzyme
MVAAVALRDFRVEDAKALNRVALAAFEQFKGEYADWLAMAERVSRMSKLAESGEIIIAEIDGRVAGGVAYLSPDKPKADYFDRSWAVIRSLVVDPVARGRGIGRSLTEECVRRARLDGASVIALHTAPIMTIALPMYLRMNFKLLRDAPPIHGVPYSVYILTL